MAVARRGTDWPQTPQAWGKTKAIRIGRGTSLFELHTSPGNLCDRDSSIWIKVSLRCMTSRVIHLYALFYKECPDH